MNTKFRHPSGGGTCISRACRIHGFSLASFFAFSGRPLQSDIRFAACAFCLKSSCKGVQPALLSGGQEFVFGVFARFVFVGTSGTPHILIPFPSRHRHFHPPDFRRQPHDQATRPA
jgi:hypothetical protein